MWVRQQRVVSHLDCVLPTFFNKRVSCLNGTNDPILVPYDSPMLDYEGELIAVIVKQAQSKSKGTITEVGLESVHGDQAQVLSRYR
ncbi:MAG: Fumarylacetoacetate hydrolase family [Mycobacterium sp.]|nr:Fumarylacetoacetate hydrolase family [Mycobacterium sp.]